MTQALQLLEEYPSQKFNLLCPPTMTLVAENELYTLEVEQVRIDPNPKNGLVHRLEDDRYMLAKPAVKAIDQVAGVVTEESKAVYMDEKSIIWQAKRKRRKPDGEWQVEHGTYEIHADNLRESIQRRNERKFRNEKYYPASKWDELARRKLDENTREEFIVNYIRQKTEDEVVEWVRHRVARAETGAMLRASRALLGLKMQYTPEELGRPFVIVRRRLNWKVLQQHDASGLVAKLLAARVEQDMLDLFGVEPKQFSPKQLETAAALTEEMEAAGAEELLQGKAISFTGEICVGCEQPIPIHNLRYREDGEPLCVDCSTNGLLVERTEPPTAEPPIERIPLDWLVKEYPEARDLFKGKSPTIPELCDLSPAWAVSLCNRAGKLPEWARLHTDAMRSHLLSQPDGLYVVLSGNFIVNRHDPIGATGAKRLVEGLQQIDAKKWHERHIANHAKFHFEVEDLTRLTWEQFFAWRLWVTAGKATLPWYADKVDKDEPEQPATTESPEEEEPKPDDKVADLASRIAELYGGHTDPNIPY